MADIDPSPATATAKCSELPASPPGWRAHLTLGFERRGEKTVLATRRHDGPLVVQKPLYQEGPAVCQAIIVHPPAGIAGGDELDVRIDAAPDAHALVTTPGAAKWYRSAGRWAEQRIRLNVAPDATLEWLPQETIVYRGALARSAIDIVLAPQARFIGWDIVCFGRTGAGERFSGGTWRARTRLFIGDRLAWLEQARIGDSDIGDDRRALESPVALGALPVAGTLLVVARGLDAALVTALRVITAERGAGAVTRLPDLLVARYRGDSGEAARGYFGRLWGTLRPPLVGRAASAPRIWRT